jgi:hypothetical protein
VRPPHVSNLEDYWLWLERLIEESGGWLRETALVVEPIGEEPSGPDDWQGLIVPQQEVVFGDGSTLTVSMVVDPDLTPTTYSFHFQDVESELVWRKCNRPGHAEGEYHIHRAPDEVAAYPQVDMEEALEQVRSYPAEL